MNFSITASCLKLHQRVYHHWAAVWSLKHAAASEKTTSEEKAPWNDCVKADLSFLHQKDAKLSCKPLQHRVPDLNLQPGAAALCACCCQCFCVCLVYFPTHRHLKSQSIGCSACRYSIYGFLYSKWCVSEMRLSLWRRDTNMAATENSDFKISVFGKSRPLRLEL